MGMILFLPACGIGGFCSVLLHCDSRLCMCSGLQTDLETEWEFAANPVTDGAKHYPGQEGAKK